MVQDGGLLLLLPWLLRRSKRFQNCHLRVFAVMTGLLAHHWNAEHGGAAEVGGASEPQLLERWRKFIRRMLAPGGAKRRRLLTALPRRASRNGFLLVPF